MRASLALLVLAGLCSAQSNDAYYEGLLTSIERGYVHTIHDRLEVGFIARDPPRARSICKAAAECDFKWGLKKKDELRAATEKIRQIGVKCAEQHRDAADAWSAKADGAYIFLIVEIAFGNKTTTESWLDLAATLVRLHELEPDGGAPLERAVKMLRLGSRAKGTDDEKLKAKEDEICRAGIETYPDHSFFTTIEQNAELDALVALIEAGEHKAAKPRVAELLASVKDDTVYNDVVTVALGAYKKLRIKAEFRARTREFFDVFEITVPRGKHWRVSSDSIRQYDRSGKIKRKFTFDFMKLNTWYVVGDSKFDGSNVKGMAKLSERDVLGAIVKVKRRSRITKKRLNRYISGAQHFEIGGFDKDADFVRFHSYVWKGKERDWLTYRLWIIEWEDFKGLDPAAEFVLDRIKELKYVKKKK